MASSATYKYVVLGGGNASGYAAREFVEQGGSAGELAIISAEPHVAYERPALSKAYLFPEKPARLPGFHTSVGGGGERQDPDWYKQKGIAYHTSTVVSAIDTASKALTTEGGDTISYEKLIYATGARPINLGAFGTPGADLEGVQYLRNVEDADALLKAVEPVKAAGGKVAVIGGGYIGMEVAAGMSLHGLPVTMVFPESRLMERFFTPEIAAFYENYYANKGIELLKGELCAGFEGKDGKVTAVQLKSGKSVPADLVVVGVGAAPNVELAKAAGIALLDSKPGGVQVDEYLRTSAPDVLAAGDVAAFPLGGSRTRQEHVLNCRLSGAHAMRVAMKGTSAGAYEYLPYFYSRVFDLGWQFYGSAEGEAVHFGDPASKKFGAFFVSDGKVVGAFLEGGSAEENAAIKKVAATTPPAPDAGALAEGGLDWAAAL